MIDRPSTKPAGEDETIAKSNRNVPLQELADSLRSTWQDSCSPSLQSYLKQHPELYSDNSLIVELAVDEYRIRRTQGQVSSIGQYCKPFSAISRSLQSSIFRQIEVERYLDDHPSLRVVEEEINWPAIGDTIAGYCILDELGRGALARVYLCSQKSLGGRHVALKVSRKGAQEGHTLGKLQHPNIMPIHSIEVEGDQGLSYLCTPFLGRSTLYDLISVSFSEGIPTEESEILAAAQLWSTPDDILATAANTKKTKRSCSYVEGIVILGIKICDALKHAHDSGIFHGDLKPSNVLLTPSGDPVLLDFNLARDDELSIDVRGGTLPYMAPEQISELLLNEEDNAARCDERSEIFSLGIVLYELLSGQIPFEIDKQIVDEESVPRQLLKLQRQGALPLTRRNPQVSSALSETIDRCLKFDRESRFSSMAELRTALKEELSPSRRVRHWIGARSRLVLGFAILAIVVFAGFAGWHASREPFYIRQYRQGLAYQAEGDFDLALSAFQKSVEANSEYLEGQFAIAYVNMTMGNESQALDQFISMATDHEHALSMAGAGFCFNSLNLPEMAAPWYEKAIEAGVELASIHNNLAICYEADHTRNTTGVRIRKAEAQYAKAVALDPSSEIIHFNIANFELLKFQHDSSYIPLKGLEHILLALKKNQPALASTLPRLISTLRFQNQTIPLLMIS